MNVSGHRISIDRGRERSSTIAKGRRLPSADDPTTRIGAGDRRLRHAESCRGGPVEKLRNFANQSRAKIGPIAKPANIVFTPELPKTPQGKIMRRRLCATSRENRARGDTTTRADPAVVEEIKDRAVAETNED
jgi:acetyl-CoA synthetase